MSDEVRRFPPIRFENDRPLPPRFDHKDRIQTVNVDSAALASALKREIKGEVRFDNGSRALYSTDASNYRQVPIGVVMPHDANDVKVASTNASTFAYVADGKYGFKVVQLTSPEWTPQYAGFSPRPAPRLIATRRTAGPALAVSKGLDRDRAVDESGNQVSIFNRIGARPMTLPEMQRLYLRDGKLYTVQP